MGRMSRFRHAGAPTRPSRAPVPSVVPEAPTEPAPETALVAASVAAPPAESAGSGEPTDAPPADAEGEPVAPRGKKGRK